MNPVRPTKKQYGMMQFIAQFIAENGYGPSYREIMNGLNYTSVATVAEHVNNLIARGHLRKRDRSARSLEVVSMPEPELGMDKVVSEAEEKWLV
jgi:repressor LexA